METKRVLLISRNEKFIRETSVLLESRFQLTIIKEIDMGSIMAQLSVPDIILVDFTRISIESKEWLESLHASGLEKSRLFVISPLTASPDFRTDLEGLSEFVFYDNTPVKQVWDSICLIVRKEANHSNFWKDHFMALFESSPYPILSLENENISYSNSLYKTLFSGSKGPRLQFADIVLSAQKLDLLLYLKNFKASKKKRMIRQFVFKLNDGFNWNGQLILKNINPASRNIVLVKIFLYSVVRNRESLESLVFSEPTPVYQEGKKVVKKIELTAREIQVLTHYSAGVTTRVVAAILGITNKTLENHRTNIIRKLGCRNWIAAIAIAVSEGYVNIDELLRNRPGRLN